MTGNASRYPRALSGLLGRIYEKPLMLAPAKAYELERVLRAHQDAPVAYREDASAPKTPVDDRGYDITSGGVALIPVMGTLVQRSSWMDSMSGLTSYDSIGYAIAQAEADPKVLGIMLEIDSLGGEVSGCFDLVDEIAASTKPVWAVANEAAYSAAYAIASAADRLFMPRTAGVGSIGVLMLHVDQSEKDKKQGYTYTPIFAGEKKYDGNSHEPLPADVKANLQEAVDRFYQMFVSTVATNRGMSADAVIATQAGTFHPGAAIDLGLADDTGTLSEALVTFEKFLASDAIAESRTAGAAPWRSSSLSASAVRFNAPKTAPAAHPSSSAATAAQPTGVHMDQQEHEAAVAAARTEAAAEATKAAATATATATAAAATAERERVSTILASEEAKGRTTMATHLATKTDMTSEAAIALLATSPKEAPIVAATNAFAAAMDAAGNPQVSSDDGDADGKPKETLEEAANAIAKYQRKPVSASK